MTRVNSMAIPTADLRHRLDLPTIKPSPKDGFKRGGVAYPRKAPAPTQKRATDWPAVFPPSSDTGAAADSPGGLPRAREPGDLHAPGDRFPGRSVILGMIGAVIRPESSPGNPA